MNKDQQDVMSYINKQEPEIKKRLETLRSLILEIFPDAIENISYAMPSYRTVPGKRPFVYMGVAKNHIGIYALHGTLSDALQKQLQPLVGGRGTLQLVNSQPLPLNLIEKALIELREQNETK